MVAIYCCSPYSCYAHIAVYRPDWWCPACLERHAEEMVEAAGYTD